MNQCEESKDWDENMKINICENRTCEECKKSKKDWEKENDLC